MRTFKLIPLVESKKVRERDMFEGFIEASLDEDYPQNFDINNFKNIRSYAGKVKYAREHMGSPIGSGSSRVVYRVDETKVLKLAKNKKGLAQNKVETEFFGEQYYFDIIAEVLDYDEEKNLWVEMEIALKPTKEHFKGIWGVNFTDLVTYLFMKNERRRGRGHYYVRNDWEDEFDENDRVQMLVSFMNDFDLVPGDLTRISSWGVVKRNGKDEMVLIDFGLTNDVYVSYYR